MRALHARLLAILAAATLLMPANAFAEIIYRCSMTGSIGPKCCCSRADERPRVGPCQAEVDRPDCCQAEQHSGPAAPGSNVEQPPTPGPAVLFATLRIVELFAGSEAALRALPQARSPPAIGPPVYLENCSLLR